MFEADRYDGVRTDEPIGDERGELVQLRLRVRVLEEKEILKSDTIEPIA